jgi:hypothetical protein
MKASQLKSSFYHYGNKGAVWSNETHIAQSGTSGTLCGTPMLATNWARIWEQETVGCPECLAKYLDLQGFIVNADNIKDIKFDEYGRPYEQTPSGKMMLSNRDLLVNKH